MTDELKLCGYRPPKLRPDLESCPREAGHDGPHHAWEQTRPNANRGRNGVWVYDLETRKVVLHATFDGAVKAEQVCALLAIGDVGRARTPDGTG